MCNRCTANIRVFGCIVGLIIIMLAVPLRGDAENGNSLLSAEELEKLALQIEAVEKKLRTIRIDSEVWVEIKVNLSDVCEPWRRTPIYVLSSAWFTGDWSFRLRGIGPGNIPVGDAAGKARVDVHKEVHGEGGSAGYMEECYSMSFDGKLGRILFHTRGPVGKASVVKEARLLAGTPNALKAGWYSLFTGIEFSSIFHLKNKGYTFSDLFRWADDPKSTVPSCFEFSREIVEGVPCIKITTKGTKSFRETWWLDSSRGFALLRYKHMRYGKDGTERLRKSIKVTKLKDLGIGLWWPVEATAILEPLKPGGAYRRIVYSASNVVANDPNFDENIFEPAFPKGYIVDDQVGGSKYTVK